MMDLGKVIRLGRWIDSALGNLLQKNALQETQAV